MKSLPNLHTVFSHPASLSPLYRRAVDYLLSSDSADQCLTYLVQLGSFRTVYSWLVVLIRDLDTSCSGVVERQMGWGVEEAT